MTTANGKYLERFVFEPGSKVARSNYTFPQESPSKKDWDAWLNFWHDYTATGTNFTPLWEHGKLQPTGDGYGTITAQPMTYTESKMGSLPLPSHSEL